MKSRPSRMVLGFYRSEEHAAEALDEVRKNHFRRSAVVHRAEDGGLKFLRVRVAPRVRMAAGILTAVAFVVGTILRTNVWALALLVFFGCLIAWLGALWLGVGIKKTVLRHYGRFVLPGESLVVVEETEKRTTDVIAVLRHIANPSVFLIRPGLRFVSSTQTDGKLREPVNVSLEDCAAALAISHQLASSTRWRPLLPVLRECEDAIERSRADLAEAARLDYGVTHAAEWLLDNIYLIRSHIADIRHNLPDNHNKILPVLIDTRCPVRLRVYHLAAELIDSTGHRLTPESIVTFLNAYQRESPLTLAELWVFPLMLRLVLLERLRRLSELADVRQHQKELADFWANRLLTAANRGPEQFERIISELDRDGKELTAHFIARLGEQLHKEESALAPIQKWIEEKTGARVGDINLREHAEEANDVTLIASAIGSARELSELQYPRIVEAVSRMEAMLRDEAAGVHARSDFVTRDRCRRVVEEAARQSKSSEWEVARLVVDLARRVSNSEREQCIAYYLLDEGLLELEKRIGRRVSWRDRRVRFMRRYPTLLYLGSLAAFTTGIVSVFLLTAKTSGVVSPGMLWLWGTLALFPASELPTFLLHQWLTSVLPPRVLPKMSFEEGIPEQDRTLVVVPMMLLTPD